MMKMKIVDGRKEFTGHKMSCPTCGHWLIKAPSPFGKVTVLDGKVECGHCGTVITFGMNTDLEWDDGK